MGGDELGVQIRRAAYPPHLGVNPVAPKNLLIIDRRNSKPDV
jgi:hypothetical protein